MTSDNLITVKEAAHVLNVTQGRIRQMCASGAFPGAFKTNGPGRPSWRIPDQDVEQYLDDHFDKMGPTDKQIEADLAAKRKSGMSDPDIVIEILNELTELMKNNTPDITVMEQVNELREANELLRSANVELEFKVEKQATRIAQYEAVLDEIEEMGFVHRVMGYGKKLIGTMKKQKD